MLLNTRIPLRFIFNKIKYESLYVLIIALIVYFFTQRFAAVLPVMPLAIPAFLGTAISVILSFKLSQSYDRWWEARKIWGGIVNDSRTLILQLQSFLPGGNEEAIKQVAFRQIAWCYSLGQSLRGLDAAAGLEKYIPPGELSAVKEHHNKPLALLQQQALQVADLRNAGKLDLFAHVQINNTMVNLSNWMGMAERIKNTIFPITYRLFLHFFIYIFVITLCIALRDIRSYFEIPLLLVISSAFFLLERSATHLQDPFSNQPTDIPVTSIATTIEINIRQLLQEKELPPVQQPDEYYIL